jgi:hypothetical protein
MAETDNSILGYFPEAELVLALVYPLGTERTGLQDILKQHLAKFGYETNPIRLTQVFPDLFKLLGKKWDAPTGAAELARYKIEAGNQIRRVTRCKDILARVAAGLIHNCRAEEADEGEKEGRPARGVAAPAAAHGAHHLQPEAARGGGHPAEDLRQRILPAGAFVVKGTPRRVF